MTVLSFDLGTCEGHDAVTVDDMGEGAIILSTAGPEGAGAVHMTLGQLREAVAILERRYG